MAKKKIKKTNSSIKEQRFGVVLEDIDSKLDLVVEGHKGLDKKIDKVDKDLKDFRNEVDYKFKAVQETLKDHTEMIAKNAENIEIIKSDIEFIKNSLRKKVDLEEFETLEKRVLLLERKFARGRT